ncbi:MAG: glycerol-3-phosphate 1-O-acyltransferase PlsY [Rhodospirillales bacterium]|nr:glycerol-3-phosphate 1-O-acyltransferase PlsY [Rhodospirillales bacterium]
MLPLLLAAIGGYLFGSIPFGLLLTRLAGHGDIRAIGSGNIGATNVLRTGNKKLALATLLLDVGKGALPTLLAAQGGDELASLVAGFAAVLGHNFPLWLGFRGGKGVATTLGVLLAISWPVGLAALALWLGSAVVFRISSLAALIALAASPLLMLAFGDGAQVVLAAVLALLAAVRHHTNIRRLLAGTEPKIGGKSPG